MRIVFVISSPSISARTLGFLTELCRRHEVAVIVLCSSSSELAATGRLLALGVRVVPVTLAPRSARRGHADDILDTHLINTPRAAQQMQAALEAELARGNVGVVHVTGMPDMYLRNIETPVIWDADICHSRLAQLNLAYGWKLRRRRAYDRAATELELYERALLRALPTITVSTEWQRAAMLELLPEAQDEPSDDDTLSLIRQPHISLLPHGARLEQPTSYDARRHHNRLVARIDGRTPLSWAALEWLAEGIMPRVWEARSDVRLTLLCDELPRTLDRFAADGRVSVVTGVTDSRTYVAGAAVALVPLPEAVGLQDTLLEPLVVGTPVVASWGALDGVAAVPERDLLVAENADEFAQHVTHVLDDEVAWRDLARNGRACVERSHSWRLAAHQLEMIYSEVSGFDYVGLAAAPVLSLRYSRTDAYRDTGRP